MRFIRSLFRGLMSVCFKLGLVSLAIVSVTIIVFGSSTIIKNALRSSKIYDNVVDNVISTSSSEGIDKGMGSSLSLAEPAIKQAANTAFSPGLIQSDSEQIIDSVYGWLQGKTTKPDFKIDLSPPKLRFATAAADNATARARQLPACTLAQAMALAASQEIDPFSLPCLPPGTDINLVRNKVISDLANNPYFLKNPIISIDNLPKDNQGKTTFDNFRNFPKYYRWLQLAPRIIGGATILSGVLLVVLYDHKWRGLRAVGVIFFGSGIFLIISTLIFNFIVSQIKKPSGQLGRLANNHLQASFIAIISSLSQSFSSKLIIFGTAYAGLGIFILLILHFIKPTEKLAESGVNSA